MTHAGINQVFLIGSMVAASRIKVKYVRTWYPKLHHSPFNDVVRSSYVHLLRRLTGTQWTRYVRTFRSHSPLPVKYVTHIRYLLYWTLIFWRNFFKEFFSSRLLKFCSLNSSNKYKRARNKSTSTSILQRQLSLISVFQLCTYGDNTFFHYHGGSLWPLCR